VFQDSASTLNAIQDRLEARGEPSLWTQLGLPVPGALPRQISSMRTNPPASNEVFFKVGRTTGWTAGLFNQCESQYFQISRDGEKDQHEYSDYNDCVMWCFLGVRPERAFGAPGDSGSLVFDRKGAAVGLLFGGIPGLVSLDYITPPDIANVISLDVVVKDLGDQLGLTDIKFANA
jgi:hypothetical protein